MSINSASAVGRELHDQILDAIKEIEAANNRFGIGALTPEQVEKNIEAIRRLEAQTVQLRLLNGL